VQKFSRGLGLTFIILLVVLAGCDQVMLDAERPATVAYVVGVPTGEVTPLPTVTRGPAESPDAVQSPAPDDAQDEQSAGASVLFPTNTPVDTPSAAPPTVTLTPTDGPSPTPTITYPPTSTHTLDPASIESATPTETPVPTATPDLPVSVKQLLFETNFVRGWPEINEGGVLQQIIDEGYRMAVNGFNGTWRFSTQVDADRYYAQLALTPASCPAEGGSYGLIFHAVDTGSFYVYILNCTGKFAVFQWEGGSWAKTLISQDLPASLWDDDPLQERTFGVKIEGSSFTLYLDDEEIAALNDDAYAGGDVGIYIGASKAEGIDVNFHQLSVWALP
jgi:hypothetical protein